MTHWDENIGAKDILETGWLATYESQLYPLRQQLATLNCNLFIIERIENFPFDIFLPTKDDRIFWQLTKNALLETCIMIIWRIAVDGDKDNTHGDHLTLGKLRAGIFQHLQNDDVKEKLQATLNKVNFDTRLSAMKKKIKNLRGNYLAHFNHELNTNINPQTLADSAISLADLKSVLDILRELFEALCFNVHRPLWHGGYSDSDRQLRRTDIDNLLDSIAKNSALLNLPESNPAIWKNWIADASSNELEILNKYRRKFGLPVVS